MTISLLRQIWQRIVDKQAAPRQRLTGFEPLEPRMVLSGFAAPMHPDYFSPPPGDFSHVERTGAEYAKFGGGEYGRFSDYNTAGAGGASIVEQRLLPVNSLVSIGPIFTPGTAGDLVIIAKPLDRADSIEGKAADVVFSGSLNSISFNASTLSDSAFSMRMEFAPIHGSLVDHVMDDGESTWIRTSSSRFDSFTSQASIGLSVLGTTLNSIEVRGGLVPSNMNAALERRMEAREVSAEGNGGAPRSSALDASLAHATGNESTGRAASSASAIAMLATQSDGLRSSSTTRTADGSTNGGQEQGPVSPTAARQQSELDEAYAVNRRGLKRKLPGDATALDENDGEDAALVQEYGDGDVILMIESGRQFGQAGNAGTQIPELALANMPVDGLIDVIAADVDSRMGDHKLLETGRLALVEPAMMAYQAFEMVIDRNSQSEGRVADAADVVTVAMNEQPVVSVQ
jgi:hypothetical protein